MSEELASVAWMWEAAAMEQLSGTLLGLILPLLLMLMPMLVKYKVVFLGRRKRNRHQCERIGRKASKP